MHMLKQQMCVNAIFKKKKKKRNLHSVYFLYLHMVISVLVGTALLLIF